MIEKETVLILGAGASVPYGFPTGEGLIKQICFYTPENALEMMGKSQAEFREFKEALWYSVLTVDEFLEHNEDLKAFGKQLIAWHIMTNESKGNLRAKKDDWYRPFIRAFDLHLDAFRSNRVKVFTFNYDRSFEQFLYLAMRSLHRKKDEKHIINAVNSIPVIHLHGRLGPLPWQEHGEDEHPREYHTNVDPGSLARAAQQIRIISDSQNDRLFQYAHEVFADARRIFFLGFGYNETNMRRLRCPQDGSPVQDGNETYKRVVMGTAHGFTKEQVRAFADNGMPVTLPDDPTWTIDVFMNRCSQFMAHKFQKPKMG